MEMGDDNKKNKKSPLKNLPFGTPDGDKGFGAANSAPSWPAPSNTAANDALAPPAGAPAAGNLSPVMEDAMGSNNNDDKATSADPSQTNDRLAKLKAKLEEKKKKLEEKKRREGKQRQDQTQGKRGASSPQPQREQQRQQQPSPAPAPTDAQGNSLAEKNAVRFATGAANQATRALLPQDLQNETATDYSALRQTHTDAQDLGSAKSLIGTCQHMCPDEELLRREREGDIQLLEIVKPGELHPQNWTLRDTCVKRFRRSAADYKLDVPEWVRPPEALERVCSYLEEWVMERDRQGPDPRFSGGTAAPPSLDVYQFIWDRTRMVRQGFYLAKLCWNWRKMRRDGCPMPRAYRSMACNV